MWIMTKIQIVTVAISVYQPALIFTSVDLVCTLAILKATSVLLMATYIAL